MRLCPHAWPTPGSASYSARIAAHGRRPTSARVGARRGARRARRGRHPGEARARRRALARREVREPSAGLVLLEAKLGVRVDPAREGEESPAHASTARSIEAGEFGGKGHGAGPPKRCQRRRARQTLARAVHGASMKPLAAALGACPGRAGVPRPSPPWPTGSVDGSRTERLRRWSTHGGSTTSAPMRLGGLDRSASALDGRPASSPRR